MLVPIWLPVVLLLTVGTDTDAHSCVVDHFPDKASCEIVRGALALQHKQSGEGISHVSHSDCIDTGTTAPAAAR